MTEVDYYEVVRQKLTLGDMYAPKIKQMSQLMKIFWNEKEIEVLSHFESADKSISLRQLAKKTGRETSELKQILRDPLKRGTIGKVGSKYCLLPLVPGIFEKYFLSGITGADTKENMKKVAKIYRYLFKNFLPQLFSENDFKLFRPLLPLDAKEKLIEINESAEVSQEILSYDLIADLIEKYDTFSSVPCQCRLSGAYAGEPCEIAPAELGCFLAGPIAEAVIARGAKRMNKEEAIEFIKKTEKAGLVHSRTADTFEVGSLIVCNCCSCHCGSLLPSTIVNTFSTETSNYIPVFNQEICEKCGICIKKCQMGAILHKMPNKEDKSDELIYVKAEFCIGCGICAANCPSEAIKLVKISDKVFPDKNLIGNKTMHDLIM